jgi:hypothetical protein
MSTMSPIRYRALCRYAGEWIDRPIERSFALDDLDEIEARSGVYVVCEPLERVHYVGSVYRPASRCGVADRLREHLRDGYKRLSWKTVWVLPLRVDAPRAVVRSVEACVGRDLVPLGGGRLPAL